MYRRANKEDRAAAIKAKIEKAREMLETGVEELQTSEQWTNFLDTMRKFHNYSFKNCLLIQHQMPGATRVAGYKTWQELGRQVRKGEHGLFVLAPSTRKNVTKTETTNPVTGDKETVEEEKKWTSFYPVSVFDISQTEGDELPTLVKGIRALSSENERLLALWEKLEQYATNDLGYNVSLDVIYGKSNGYCDYSNKKIVVREENSALHQVKTLVHEIAHAELHSNKTVEHTSYDVCEVEAESVAYCVLSYFGFNSAPYSFGYVGGWSHGDSKIVEEAGANIQRTAHKLIEMLEEAESTDLDCAA